ncbi:MAG TPA: response regulator, partial [Allocoleopsis sp.]
MIKILLVADDPLLLSSLSQACRNHGYTIGTTTSDWKSLELARPQEYDLILLDTHLSQPNGIRVCHQLRAQGNQKPILLLISCHASKLHRMK